MTAFLKFLGNVYLRALFNTKVRFIFLGKLNLQINASIGFFSVDLMPFEIDSCSSCFKINFMVFNSDLGWKFVDYLLQLNCLHLMSFSTY
jgi:hypothetical protein